MPLENYSNLACLWVVEWWSIYRVIFQHLIRSPRFPLLPGRTMATTRRSPRTIRPICDPAGQGTYASRLQRAYDASLTNGEPGPRGPIAKLPQRPGQLPGHPAEESRSAQRHCPGQRNILLRRTVGLDPPGVEKAHLEGAGCSCPH